jgi:hypothetical protein
MKNTKLSYTLKPHYEDRIVDRIKFRGYAQYDSAIILKDPSETYLFNEDGEKVATIPGELWMDQILAILEIIKREVRWATESGAKTRSQEIYDLLMQKWRD